MMVGVMRKLIFLGIILLLAGVGLLYFNYDTEYIAYDKDEILVPISVHLVDDGTVQYTSSRDIDDIYRIFEEVNRIWGQAQIKFIVSEINTLRIENEEFNNVFYGKSETLTKRDDFNNGINGYFARYISANGMAFPPQGIFIIG